MLTAVHPWRPQASTNQAIQELGRVVRAIFICDYLASP
jgi:TnpA family transposase